MSSVRPDQTQSNGSMKILKLVVVSAKGLRHVHLISSMNPFTVVSVAGHHRRSTHVIKTHTDHNGGRNPVWSFYLEFDQLPESELQQNRLTLVLRIRSQGLFCNRDIGKVVVPMKQLLDLESSRDNGMPPVMTTLPVTTSSGKYQGHLTFYSEFNDSPTPANGDRTTPEEKTNFMVSWCIPEFFARVCGTVVGDVLSDVIL